jgi:hypothetical protein
MTPSPPSIDQILTTFFRAQCNGAVGVRLGRITGIERRLREFLEANGHLHLCAHHQAVLRRELQLGRPSPVARNLRAEGLLDFIWPFVDLWRPHELEDRRLQLLLVADLVGSILDRRLLDGSDIPFARELRRQTRLMEADLPARREPQH